MGDKGEVVIAEVMLAHDLVEEGHLIVGEERGLWPEFDPARFRGEEEGQRESEDKEGGKGNFHHLITGSGRPRAGP